MDPAMLPPPPFPNSQIPFPPGLNLFPPAPPLPDHSNMAPLAKGQKRKGKKRKGKKGQDMPTAPPFKSNPTHQHQKQRQGPQTAGHGVPPLPGAQPHFAYPTEHVLSAHRSLFGQPGPQGQLAPHEQQFLEQLQALMHTQQPFPQPFQPLPGPGAAAPMAPAPRPSAGKALPSRPPPTGPKAQSRQPRRPSPGPKRDGGSSKRPPSAASGGVPEPTPFYLSNARLPPFPSPQPRPLLVIIDLNGTLVHRPSRRANPTNFRPRPHASPFLHYVITTFTTMIWSSAKPENVRSMTDRLLDPPDRASLLALWGREAFGFTERDYNDRVQCYKRLSRVWEDPAVRDSHPMGLAWDQSNTVLIDDSAEKARSEPYNLIEIPEYLGGGDGGPDDDILPQVHTYLNTLSMQGDVSRYIRQNPFRPQDKFVLN